MAAPVSNKARSVRYQCVRTTYQRARVAVRRKAHAGLEVHAREREARLRVERGQKAAREVLRKAHEVVRVPREVLRALLLPERRRRRWRLARLSPGLPTGARGALPERTARLAPRAGAGQRALRSRVLQRCAGQRTRRLRLAHVINGEMSAEQTTTQVRNINLLKAPLDFVFYKLGCQMSCRLFF